MKCCLKWAVAAAVLAGVAFLPSDRFMTAAPPTKPTPKPAAKPAKKPHPPTKKTFKVQARAPQWRGVAVVANQSAAKAIRRNLVHHGWQVKVRHSRRGGAYAVSARMVHWHTRAVVRNPAAAQRAAAMLIAQGFQARII
jgi:hypothetical protein